MQSFLLFMVKALCLLSTCLFCDGFNMQSGAYSTNFSTLEASMWTHDAGCFDCSAKNPDECTMNYASDVHLASIAQNAGLTIDTAQMGNLSYCSGNAGGHSGHLTFKPKLSFGTIRVKSKYFPGSKDLVKSAKGFIGLEDSSSGAITITIHGKGATASGAPAGADWTRMMQSSCYQHGDNHNKEFTELASSVDVAENFNEYEVIWTSTSVTIKVNGKQVRSVTDASKVPQNPLQVKLHSRSIAYSDMPSGGTFASYIQEFSYEPLSASMLV